MLKSKQILSGVIATSLIVGIGASQAHALTNGVPNDINDSYSRSVVNIRVNDSNNPQDYDDCSGVLVDDNWVLTSSQCIQGAQQDFSQSLNGLKNSLMLSSSSLSSGVTYDNEDNDGNDSSYNVEMINTLIQKNNGEGTNLNKVSHVEVNDDLALLKLQDDVTTSPARVKLEDISNKRVETRTYSWEGANNKLVYASGTTSDIKNIGKIVTYFDNNVHLESRDLGSPIFSNAQLIGIQTGKENIPHAPDNYVTGTLIREKYNWFKQTMIEN